MPAAEPLSFDALFTSHIKALKARAAATGVPWKHVCQDAGVSRGLADSWETRTPETISKVAALERAIGRAESRSPAKA